MNRVTNKRLKSCCRVAAVVLFRSWEKEKKHDVMIHTQITFISEPNAFCSYVHPSTRPSVRQPVHSLVCARQQTRIVLKPSQLNGWFVYFVLRSLAVFTSIDCNEATRQPTDTGTYDTHACTAHTLTYLAYYIIKGLKLRAHTGWRERKQHATVSDGKCCCSVEILSQAVTPRTIHTRTLHDELRGIGPKAIIELVAFRKHA